MKFSSEDDAKNYAIQLTAKHINPEDIEKRLEYFKSYLASSSDKNKEYWQREVNSLEKWIASEEFKNGEYPRGLDELVLELVEWRAAVFAFQHVKTQKDPFKQHAFYAQWLVGGTYTMFCLLGKLVGKDRRDNSLRNLWTMVKEYVGNSGLCGNGELEYINEKLDTKNGQFTNESSQAMRYRNKVIAHNEHLPRMEWSELDKDIELICRIWSLITMWSSFGLIEPFRESDKVFSGTEAIFSQTEIQQLKNQRKEYLSKVSGWCENCVVNGERVIDRSPFGKLSVTIKPQLHGK